MATTTSSRKAASTRRREQGGGQAVPPGRHRIRQAHRHPAEGDRGRARVENYRDEYEQAEKSGRVQNAGDPDSAL